jgi:hypothetical protein
MDSHNGTLISAVHTNNLHGFILFTMLYTCPDNLILLMFGESINYEVHLDGFESRYEIIGFFN